MNNLYIIFKFTSYTRMLQFTLPLHFDAETTPSSPSSHFAPQNQLVIHPGDVPMLVSEDHHFP